MQIQNSSELIDRTLSTYREKVAKNNAFQLKPIRDLLMLNISALRNCQAISRINQLSKGIKFEPQSHTKRLTAKINVFTNDDIDNLPSKIRRHYLMLAMIRSDQIDLSSPIANFMIDDILETDPKSLVKKMFVKEHARWNMRHKNQRQGLIPKYIIVKKRLVNLHNFCLSIHEKYKGSKNHIESEMAKKIRSRADQLLMIADTCNSDYDFTQINLGLK